MRALLGACLIAVATQAAALVTPSLWGLPGDFLDEHGQSRHLAEFAQRSEPTIVSMEYTECRFVCSVAWRRLIDIQAEADKRGQKVHFLILSLDPEHDSPALWREYRKMRGLKRENWTFLTGKRPATDLAVQRLGVRWWRFDGNIMHDFRIVRLDAKGQVLRVMDNYDQPASLVLDD